MRKLSIVICILTIFLFYGSFNSFYTHDDFFLLKIAKADNLEKYLGFFNIIQGPDGLGMYRPLTTQVFYNLGWSLFELEPFWLHFVAYLGLLYVTYLVYRLAFMLLENKKAAAIASLLYALSATHFGHMYYLATFQEIGVTIFILLATIHFIHYLKSANRKEILISTLYFLFSLLSKETAIVYPAIMTITYLYFSKKFTIADAKRLLLALAPSLLILLIYSYFRIFHYGFAQGDSYIWDVSPRLFNTLFWYILWALNLPEMFVDFIGPGLNINPNLFRFWRGDVIPIFALFLVQAAFIVLMFIRDFTADRAIKSWKTYFYLGLWFLVTLLPVIFLPLHKFTFYLTLPLVAVSILLANILQKQNKFVIGAFIVIFFLLSYLTLNLTVKTNWITQGAKTAEAVHTFFNENPQVISENNSVAFINTEADKSLPWLPSATLKVVLSDDNYFQVFHDGTVEAYYEGDNIEENAYTIHARQFLGY